MLNKYTILVNSSDGFEDCWNPFFTMFKKYWPDCSAPVFLNTEVKIWAHPGIDIHCTTVQIGQKARLTWSECLQNALDQIKTPLVLYLQEDYFIHKPVHAEIISKAADHMHKNPHVKHIALTRHGSWGPYESYSEDGYKVIPQRARYRISTQAALWRVDALKSYLRREENGWMFEIYGTWRASHVRDVFLCANASFESGEPAIDYLHTGIIKGKWLPAIREEFEQHGIHVDYEKRGFYQEKPRILRKIDVILRLISRPIYFLGQLYELILCRATHMNKKY